MDHIIPWALSTVRPSELRTSTDPVVRDQQRADALLWAREGMATWKHDRCNRCGERYAVLSPECVNKLEHKGTARKLANSESPNEGTDEEEPDTYWCPWCGKDDQTNDHIRECSGYRPSGMPDNENSHPYGCACHDCMDIYRKLK